MKSVTALLFSLPIISALQCNGCRGCGKRDLKLEPDNQPVSISYAWISSIDEIENHPTPFNEVANKKYGGEYLEKLENAVGVVVKSEKNPIAVAGWVDSDTESPWNYYRDQNHKSQEAHYIKGMSKVWLGFYN